jgi:RES domain-containing protein
MSESRALALLELLVHLTAEAPDRYLLGGADIPPDLPVSTVLEDDLPLGWRTPLSIHQTATRMIGDEWVKSGRSAVLSVPSVIVAERNFVLNPAHSDFRRIAFLVPAPFEFDGRLYR